MRPYMLHHCSDHSRDQHTHHSSQVVKGCCQVSCQLTVRLRLISHFTHLISQITNTISHFSLLISYFSHLISHVIHLISHVTQPVSHFNHLISHVTNLISLVTHCLVTLISPISAADINLPFFTFLPLPAKVTSSTLL